MLLFLENTVKIKLQHKKACLLGYIGLFDMNSYHFGFLKYSEYILGQYKQNDILKSSINQWQHKLFCSHFTIRHPGLRTQCLRIDMATKFSCLTEDWTLNTYVQRERREARFHSLMWKFTFKTRLWEYLQTSQLLNLYYRYISVMKASNIIKISPNSNYLQTI